MDYRPFRFALIAALLATHPALAQEEAKPAAEPAATPAAEPAEKPAERPRDATVVQLRIRGSFADSVSLENPFGPSPLSFKGLLDILKKAQSDDAVAGLILQVEETSFGFAKLRELATALAEFRASGKKIYAYAETLGTPSLILYSTASRLTMPESGMAMFPGVMAEDLYLKSFFEKLGVRFLVMPVGEYKSAFESFARDEMSPELREVLESLVDAFHVAILDLVSTNRSIPRENVAEAIDRAVASPSELKELRLIDEIAHRDHFIEDVKADLGVEKLKVLTSYGQKSIDLDPQNPFAVFRLVMEALSPPTRRVSSKPKIAIIYANGIILSGKSRASPFGGGVTMGSETMVEAIDKAARDSTVKAIVLRIDSPGGSGTASDAIWRAVKEAGTKKPVVASMSDVAGSGGYYIAMAANRILAQPETITGSIGVVSAMVNVRGTLDLLGIRSERVSRGKRAALFSPFSPPDPAALEPLRKFMETFYWQFVDKAAEGRGKTRDELHAVARGRVWTGRQAVERGLVDELGGLDRAIAVARELAVVEGNEKLELTEAPQAPNFFEALSETFGVSLDLRGLLSQEASPAALAFLAMPELRKTLEKAFAIAAAAREGPVMVLPIEVHVR